MQESYTLKLYDSYFIEDHKKKFREYYTGTNIFTDNHFIYDVKFVKRVHYLTSVEVTKKNTEILEKLKRNKKKIFIRKIYHV